MKLLLKKKGEGTPNFVTFIVWNDFSLLEFTPRKAWQPIKGLELQEKEAQKD